MLLLTTAPQQPCPVRSLPATLVGQLAQLLAKCGIIVPRGTVAHALAIGIDDTARPPFAHPMAVLEMHDSFPLRGGRQN